MNRSDREDDILQLLSGRTSVGIAEIATHFSVSEATARRDVQQMAGSGLVRRVRGGATLRGISRLEPLFRDKEDRAARAKRAIAASASSLIRDGNTIYLDGGSTVLSLAPLLDTRRNLTIVTNSVMAAVKLLDTRHRLLLTGGEFRSLSRTLVGPLTEALLEQLQFDIAFMGTMGVSVERGMMTTDPNEAFTKAQAMSRAGTVALLMDSSKFNATALARTGTASDIDILITEAADDSLCQQLAEHHVLVQIATSSNKSLSH